MVESSPSTVPIFIKLFCIFWIVWSNLLGDIPARFVAKSFILIRMSDGFWKGGGGWGNVRPQAEPTRRGGTRDSTGVGRTGYFKLEIVLHTSEAGRVSQKIYFRTFHFFCLKIQTRINEAFLHQSKNTYFNTNVRVVSKVYLIVYGFHKLFVIFC